MSETNGSTNNGNGHAESIIARLGAKNSRMRTQNRDLQNRITELEKANQTLTTQVKDLSERTDTKKLQERVTQLQGQLRERDHKEVFHKTAKTLGARDEALDDLWSLSGYRPETDIPDETTITELITEQKTKRGYLFGQSSASPPPQPQPRPGPASGKGGSSTTGVPIVNEDLLKSDAEYAMRNNDRVVEAAKAAVARRGG